MKYIIDREAMTDKTCLCLTRDDCKVLLPLIKKALKNSIRKREKYQDIQDGGEATERQQTILCVTLEECDRIQLFVDFAENIINNKVSQ